MGVPYSLYCCDISGIKTRLIVLEAGGGGGGGVQTSVTGNAGTATALQTARAINGVAFDGTAPITVTAAAGTLTGTTLNSGVTISSLISAAGGNFGTGAFASAFNPAIPGAIGGTTPGAITGTVIIGTSFSGSGASLTGLDAGNISSGTMSFARLVNTQTVGNADATIASGTRDVILNAAMTLPRTFTLPLASAYPAGARISFSDMANTLTAANTATLARAGADTINGGTSMVLNTSGASPILISDGVSKWNVDIRGVSRGGTGATTAAAARTNLGLGTTDTAAFTRVNAGTFGDSGGIAFTSSFGVMRISGGGTNSLYFGFSDDCILARDAANTLAQRNSTNAQTFRAYNTYTDASNYERGVFGWTSNVLRIGTEMLGTGTMRSTHIIGNAVQVMTGSAGGTIQARFEEDITYLRSWLCLGTTGVNAMAAVRGAEAGKIQLLSGAGTNTGFTALQFGGTTSSFPSLKRSTTTLQARLADDSDFAAVQSLYQRFGAGTPEAAVAAPVGATYNRTDGGAGTSFYVKESGAATNTGWVAK